MPGIKSITLQRLLQDWEQRRHGRDFPTRSDFDPLDLKYVLGDLSLIDVLHDPLRFRIRLHGTNVVDRGGVDLTGKFIDEMPDERRRANMTRHWRQVIADRRPSVIAFEDEYSDQRRWNCEILLLPLSSDGTTIDMLMTAFAWAETTGG